MSLQLCSRDDGRRAMPVDAAIVGIIDENYDEDKNGEVQNLLKEEGTNVEINYV